MAKHKLKIGVEIALEVEGKSEKDAMDKLLRNASISLHYKDMDIIVTEYEVTNEEV